MFVFFFFNLFIYFIYLFLAALGLPCCVRAFSSCGEWGLLFVAVRGLLIVVASHCGGFSCCGARALGARASVVGARGLSSYGSRALECRLSSCGARASLLRGVWELPGPGLEPLSPALAGGFLTTAPPGKPAACFARIFKHCFIQLKLGVPFLPSKCDFWENMRVLN